MVPPKQLDPTEQDALVKQIGLAILRAAPEDWDRVTVEYRAVGRYAEADGEIVYSDDELGDWPVPQEIAALFGRLRAGMYRDGRGTWFNATYRLDHPSSYNLDYDRDEPDWRQPPPPQAYADDLQTFPRTGDNIPEWLMRRVSNQPAELPGPRFRVARIFDGQAGNGRPLVNRPTVPEGDRGELLEYLNSAPVVSTGRGPEIDRLDPEGRPLVPVAFHTDGSWIWPAAVNYYLHSYGIAPEHELMDHIRRQGFHVPDVDEAARAAAAGFLGRGGPAPPPPGPMRPPVPATPPMRRPPLADGPPRVPEAGPPRPLTDGSPRLPGDAPPFPFGDGPPRLPSDGPPFPLGEGPARVPDAGRPFPFGDATPYPPGEGPPFPFGEATAQPPGDGSPRLPDAGPPPTVAASRPPVVEPPRQAGPPPAALPSQGPPAATVDALRSRLTALGVPASAYRIGPPAERTWTMDQTPDGWRVGWYEREFVAPAMFEDVADASAFLLGKIMLDAGRPAAQEPASEPKPAAPEPILVPIPAAVAEPADAATVRADPVAARAPESQPTMVGPQPTMVGPQPTMFAPAPTAAVRVEPRPAEPRPAEPAARRPAEPEIRRPTEPEARRSAQPAQRWPIQPMSGEPPLTLFRGKRMIDLAPGTEIDRFGNPDGNLTYAAGTPFTERSLVPDWIERPYHTYRVERPFQALSGEAIPWFEQAGGGTAYVLPEAVGDLLADGRLTELPGRKPPTG